MELPLFANMVAFTLPERLSIIAETPITKRQLVFGGCGGMYYAIGVAATIQENFRVGRETVVSGSSAGCFPALLTALDMDVEDMFET